MAALGRADVPAVSVVVPTYCRSARVERLIVALDAQDLNEPFEVLVVDDASTDDTAARLHELAARRPHLRCVRLDRNGGPARARNAGWRSARAPLVAFVDDDCVPTEGWLRELIGCAAAADLVQGAVLPDPAQLAAAGPFSRTLRAEEERYYQTANVLYRRDLLERLGGFDERFRNACGEDTELAYRAKRAGAATAFAAAAVVHHDVSPSDLRAHVRDIQRWVDIPLVVALQPQVRELLHRRIWWRPSHPVAVAAAAGGAAALVGLATGRPLVLVSAAALGVPYARYRIRVAPVGRSRREKVAVLPVVLLEDLLEVATMIRGSIRHRALVL